MKINSVQMEADWLKNFEFQYLRKNKLQKGGIYSFASFDCFAQSVGTPDWREGSEVLRSYSFFL